MSKKVYVPKFPEATNSGVKLGAFNAGGPGGGGGGNPPLAYPIYGYITEGGSGVEAVSVELRGPYLTLPYLYDCESITLALGSEVCGVDPNWSKQAALKGGVVSDNIDGNGAASAYVTKSILCNPTTQGGECRPTLDLGGTIHPDTEIIRLAFLCCTAWGTEGGRTIWSDQTTVQMDAGGPPFQQDYAQIHRYAVSNPNVLYWYWQWQRGQAQTVNWGLGGAISGQSWTWNMFQLNTTNGGIWFGSKVPGTTGLSGSSGVGGPRRVPQFRTVGYRAWVGGPTFTKIAKVFIGSGDDDWPV